MHYETINSNKAKPAQKIFMTTHFNPTILHSAAYATLPTIYIYIYIYILASIAAISNGFTIFIINKKIIIFISSRGKNLTQKLIIDN